MVVWATVAQMVWPYEACTNDMIIRIQRGRITMVLRSHMEAPYMLKAMQEVIMGDVMHHHNVVYLDC